MEHSKELNARIDDLAGRLDKELMQDVMEVYGESMGPNSHKFIQDLIDVAADDEAEDADHQVSRLIQIVFSAGIVLGMNLGRGGSEDA